MKLFREGNNEVRIHLTKEDLQEFSITPEEIDYDSKKGRRIFRELFEKVKKETGFNAEGEKLYIQLYPIEKGGCELFFTKLTSENSTDCFSFSSFDAIYDALETLTDPPQDMQVFQNQKNDLFYTLLPSECVPNVFYEFGEKIQLPSHLFLKTRCRKVSWNQRKNYDLPRQ